MGEVDETLGAQGLRERHEDVLFQDFGYGFSAAGNNFSVDDQKLDLEEVIGSQIARHVAVDFAAGLTDERVHRIVGAGRNLEAEVLKVVVSLVPPHHDVGGVSHAEHFVHSERSELLVEVLADVLPICQVAGSDGCVCPRPRGRSVCCLQHGDLLQIDVEVSGIPPQLNIFDPNREHQIRHLVFGLSVVAFGRGGADVDFVEHLNEGGREDGDEGCHNDERRDSSQHTLIGGLTSDSEGRLACQEVKAQNSLAQAIQETHSCSGNQSMFILWNSIFEKRL